MSKKTNAEKHLLRRTEGYRRGKRRNPAFGKPLNFTPFPMSSADMVDAAIDLMIMGMIRTSGLRDILKKAIVKAPPTEDLETPATVQ